MAFPPVPYTAAGTAAVDATNAAVGAVDNNVTAEVRARQQDVADLRGVAQQEAQARAAGDAALTSDVQAEIGAREALAAHVDQGLGAEAAARGQVAASVSDLRTNTTAAIQAEQGARAALGDELAADITAANRAREDLGASLEAADATEAAARTEGDAALGRRADDQDAARQALAVDLDTVRDAAAQEAKDRAAGDAGQAAALIVEVGARSAGDVALGARIDAEAADRVQAIDVLRLFQAAAARPGDVPEAFVADLSAIASAPLPMWMTSAPGVAGRALRITGTGTLAPLALCPVEAGRFVKVRATLNRWRDTDDPAGDAVELAVAWYGADRRQIAPAARVALDLLRLTDGVRTFAALVSPDLGGAAVIRPPVGAAYLRPYVMTWGVSALTDVLTLSAEVVADVSSPDVDELTGRIGTLEQQQQTAAMMADADAYLSALLFGGV